MTTIIGPRPGEPDITLTVTAPAPLPPIDPPPVTPPPSGNVLQAKSSAEILALLKRTDIGVQPVIMVPKNTVLTTFALTTAHGGTQTNPYTVRGEDSKLVQMDCKGGRYGIEFKGGHDLAIEDIGFTHGNFEQNGIITLGDGTLPPASKRIALRRLWHDQTCIGPARASTGTSLATAHFIYVSKVAAGQTIDDITIEDCVGHADDKGMAAFLHGYAANVTVNRLVLRRNTAYGYTQAVMFYAGNFVGVVIDDFNGVDCYTVFRLNVGTGRITNARSSHPSSLARTNALYAKSAGWSIDSVAGLG